MLEGQYARFEMALMLEWQEMIFASSDNVV